MTHSGEIELKDITGRDIRGRAGRFFLDLRTGRYRAERDVVNDPNRPWPQGFGQKRLIGLGPRPAWAFGAVYVDGERVMFVIIAPTLGLSSPLVFDLADPGVVVCREAIAPFVRQLRVVRQGKEDVRVRYWRWDLDGFPDTDHADLFAFAHFLQQRPEKLAGFWYFRRNPPVRGSIPTAAEAQEEMEYRWAAAASIGYANPLPPFGAKSTGT